MAHRILFLLTIALLAGLAADDTHQSVLRATLDNGLRVVIVRDPLAPVVTVEENYLAGGNDTPAGFPGMAHAQEHMAFRGCAGLSADQISAIYAQLGGTVNADTQQTITQYFVTVPAQDLEVALRVDAACMQDVQDSQEQWAEERGAIEQEVSRDLSNPTYKFITRLNEDLFAGTPYAHDALGTRPSFDATTGEMLKKFYKDWYAPNNAILVIAGDVDPAATLAKVKQLYGPIPRRAVPAHAEVKLQPVKAESFTLDSNLPYELVFVSVRMPGTDSPDFAAGAHSGDVVVSQRADLYGSGAGGQSVGYGVRACRKPIPKPASDTRRRPFPAGSDPAPITAEIKTHSCGLRGKGRAAGIGGGRAQRRNRGRGVPAELHSATWRPPGRRPWPREGRNSPTEIVDAMKKVTVEDVNRVAKTYLTMSDAIVATLKPSPSGEAVAGKGFGGAEATTVAPTKPVVLPDWAEASVKSLKVPPAMHDAIRRYAAERNAADRADGKGQPDGYVDRLHQARGGPADPPGKEGVGEVLSELFSYGTTTRDRLAFQKELDDIAASESGGAEFNLKVLKQYFAKGVELLADNELHPALPAEAFQIVRDQTGAVDRGQHGEPGIPDAARARTRAAAEGRPGAARSYAARQSQR